MLRKSLRDNMVRDSSRVRLLQAGSEKELSRPHRPSSCVLGGYLLSCVSVFHGLLQFRFSSQDAGEGFQAALPGQAFISSRPEG